MGLKPRRAFAGFSWGACAQTARPRRRERPRGAGSAAREAPWQRAPQTAAQRDHGPTWLSRLAGNRVLGAIRRAFGCSSGARAATWSSPSTAGAGPGRRHSLVGQRHPQRRARVRSAPNLQRGAGGAADEAAAACARGQPTLVVGGARLEAERIRRRQHRVGRPAAAGGGRPAARATLSPALERCCGAAARGLCRRSCRCGSRASCPRRRSTTCSTSPTTPTAAPATPSGPTSAGTAHRLHPCRSTSQVLERLRAADISGGGASLQLAAPLGRGRSSRQRAGASAKGGAGDGRSVPLAEGTAGDCGRRVFRCPQLPPLVVEGRGPESHRGPTSGGRVFATPAPSARARASVCGAIDERQGVRNPTGAQPGKGRARTMSDLGLSQPLCRRFFAVFWPGFIHPDRG